MIRQPIDQRGRHLTDAIIHSLGRPAVAFDEDRLVDGAGLLVPATLAPHLGVRGLVAEHLDLRDAPARANAGDKLLTLVASAIAGGDCIDDADGLRAGDMAAVLTTRSRALDAGHLPARLQLGPHPPAGRGRAGAARAPGTPAPVPANGRSSSTSTRRCARPTGWPSRAARASRTCAPAATTRSSRCGPSGEVLDARLRGGRSPSGRGAPGFLAETVSRVRRAGASGELTARADSGFYAHAVVAACRRAEPASASPFARTAPCGRPSRPSPRTPGSTSPTGRRASRRWPRRRTRPSPRAAMPGRCGSSSAGCVPHPAPGWPCSRCWTTPPFITDRDGEILALEADHRGHTEVENAIRDLKHGLGLDHLPSGRFAANAAWLWVPVVAHELLRWLASLLRAGREPVHSASDSLTSRQRWIPA